MSGARNAVTVPLNEYKPKNCVAISGGDSFAISVRDADRPVTKKSAKNWNVMR